MVKELYINETLFLSLAENKTSIKAVFIGEQYRGVHPKELKKESYQFIKQYPVIMEKLEQGSIIESFKDGSMTKSIIGTEKFDNELTKEKYLEVLSEAVGYSFEESIEKLEFAMHEEKQAPKKLYKDRVRYVKETK